MVTLADMRRAAKSNGKYIPKSELVRIPSQKTREAIYREASDAISNREVAALPTHGGRWWKCDVKIIEKKKSFLPLFRWFRGTLELACLPHLFEQIEDEENYAYANELALENRKASSISLSSLQIQCLPEVERLWTSPNNETFRKRKKAVAQSIELEKRELLINKIILGLGQNGRKLKPFKPTRAQTMMAGLYKFIRDGLWVIGQEESWQEERKSDFDLITKIRPLDCFILANRDQVRKQKLSELKKERQRIDENPIRYTLADATKELRARWKNVLSEEEKNVWIEKARCLNLKKEDKWNHKETSSKSKNPGEDMQSMISYSPRKTKKHKKLTPEQINLCYTTCLSHFETIINTVRARDLHHQLADGGFDLLRERGRGRYDMTIPAFDSKSFSFLTSPNAFWMPVVREVLGGKEVTLVHKGCFLGLPGAEVQVYHQDGLHLNKKVQKPCHAVNVFIPLVDLTMKNGPTEFCLGTHMLGNENFNKENIDMPLAAAGTPIIFDYRLGHRGMGNSGNDPRPILYLTYSTENKCFVDSVNFSKKRYRKIGDLVEKPLSRDERCRRRSGRKSNEISET